MRLLGSTARRADQELARAQTKTHPQAHTKPKRQKYTPVEVVADAAPWESAWTPPMLCASARPAAWPVVVVASEDAVAEDCLDRAELTSLKARADPVVVRAVAELAITARSWAWETPMLEATAGDGGGRGGGLGGGGEGERGAKVRKAGMKQGTRLGAGNRPRHESINPFKQTSSRSN